MSTQHTQGRLKTGTGPHGVLSILEEIDECPVGGAFSLDDARRLVACWNRLEKFTTEQIEDLGYDLFADVRPDFERVMRERDELLNDLRPLITKRMGAEQIREGIQRAIARVAIAKVEGGAT